MHIIILYNNFPRVSVYSLLEVSVNEEYFDQISIGCRVGNSGDFLNNESLSSQAIIYIQGELAYFKIHGDIIPVSETHAFLLDINNVSIRQTKRGFLCIAVLVSFPYQAVEFRYIKSYTLMSNQTSVDCVRGHMSLEST